MLQLLLVAYFETWRRLGETFCAMHPLAPEEDRAPATLAEDQVDQAGRQAPGKQLSPTVACKTYLSERLQEALIQLLPRLCRTWHGTAHVAAAACQPDSQQRLLLLVRIPPLP